MLLNHLPIGRSGRFKTKTARYLNRVPSLKCVILFEWVTSFVPP